LVGVYGDLAILVKGEGGWEKQSGGDGRGGVGEHGGRARGKGITKKETDRLSRGSGMTYE